MARETPRRTGPIERGPSGFARLLSSGSTEWPPGQSAKKIAGQDSSSRTFLSSGCLFGFAGGGSTRASESAERPSIATAIVWPKSLTVPKPTAASSCPSRMSLANCLPACGGKRRSVPSSRITPSMSQISFPRLPPSTPPSFSSSQPRPIDDSLIKYDPDADIAALERNPPTPPTITDHMIGRGAEIPPPQVQAVFAIPPYKNRVASPHQG